MPIPGDLSLQRLVDDHVLKTGQRCFYVSDSEAAPGLITLEDLKGLDRNRRDAMTAGEIMAPLSALNAIDAEEDLWGLIQRMGQEGATLVPVVEDGRFLGLLTRETVMRHIRLRSELAA